MASTLRLTVKPKFLSSQDCAAKIAMFSGDMESLSNRSRVQYDSEREADDLFERAGPFQLITDAFGNEWVPVGLNSRFRLARYEAGQQFTDHEDMPYFASHKLRSFTTFMVYLDTVADGGQTVFSHHGVSVAPSEGTLVLFETDGIIHHGAIVNSPFKHIFRTDVMYRCENLKNEQLHIDLFEATQEAERLDSIDIDLSVAAWKRVEEIECVLRQT